MNMVMGTVAADTANVLAGTDLQSAPAQGIVFVWVASSQADTRVWFGSPARQPLRNITPLQRTNGVPLVSDDPVAMLAVNGGEALNLQVDINTAASCGYICKFIGQTEL